MKGNAARLPISAPLWRSWRRLAAMAGPGVPGSAGPQNPRRKPGRWRRIPAWSGCRQLQIPMGIPMAIGPLSLWCRRRRPYRPQGRTQPQNPAWSMTPRRWRGLPEPERRPWPVTRSQSGIAWATHPWRRSLTRREMWDAQNQVEGTLSATATTYPSSSASTQRWGWTPSCSTSTAWTTRRTA